MGSREFNRDMGEYLARRKMRSQGMTKNLLWFISGEGRARTKPARRLAEKYSDDAKQEPAEPHVQEKELENMEAKMEEINEIEHAVEERREGLLQGFFRKLKMFNRQEAQHEGDSQEEETVPAEPQIDEETKQVLKLTYSWLNHLPEDKIESFRSSPDFEMYKKVLAKYGLVKQRQQETEGRN